MAVHIRASILVVVISLLSYLVVGAPIEEHDDAVGNGELYWRELENGATEAQAEAAMRRATASSRLKEASHGGQIYWALLELGASEDTATNVLRLSRPTDELERQVWRDALCASLLELGFTGVEAEALVPDIQLSVLGEDLCWVYPVKLVWCDQGWKRSRDTEFINGQCWDDFIGQCFLQTCGSGEVVWYSVTLSNSCVTFLPSTSTCVSMRVGAGTWEKCSNTHIFDCSCIAETQCSDVEQDCCHNLDGCTGCPDCQ